MNTRVKHLSAFNYFGAKHRHLTWLLPLLYPASPKQHYLEPFAGSYCVFLNKKPDGIETVNDIDARVYNFFNVLRNAPDELINLLQLTPYSREEFYRCNGDTDNPMENARHFFIRLQQSYGGADGSGRITGFRHSYNESRNGVNLNVNKWFNKISGLNDIIHRLKMATFENRDAFFLLQTHNLKHVFTYQDPPYVHDARTGKTDYAYEFSTDDHIRLAAINNSFKGKVALSGYDSELYNELYPKSKGWYKNLGPTRRSNLGNKLTREILWTNYPPPTGDLTLFD